MKNLSLRIPRNTWRTASPPESSMESHGKYEQEFRCRSLVVETTLAVPERWFYSPPAKTIQLLVHMLPKDQCTRFAISKMTTIKACPTFHKGRCTPYHYLPPKMPRRQLPPTPWPMSAEHRPHPSTN